MHLFYLDLLLHVLPVIVLSFCMSKYNISFEAFAVNKCDVGFCSDQSWKRGLHDEGVLGDIIRC